jgi:hypothetical protein
MGYPTDGQLAAAREALLTPASIALERRTADVALPLILSVRAETYLALGERAEALASAQEAIDRAREGGCVYMEADAQLALARVLLVADLPRVEIETALGRAEELVASIEGARCRCASWSSAAP